MGFDECVASVPNFGMAVEAMINFVRNRSEPGGINERTLLRYPVALFFVRGDRGGKGKTMAEECIASFNYWDLDSGNNIDILFPGWKKSSPNIEFDTYSFYQFKKEIESISKWRFGGEAEILLINFDYSPFAREGKFKFNESISLPIEEMIRKGISSSVDALLHEVISASKEIKNGSVWEISDTLGYQKARRSLWEYLKKKVTGGLANVYDDLRPFAVCNLEI